MLMRPEVYEAETIAIEAETSFGASRLRPVRGLNIRGNQLISYSYNSHVRLLRHNWCRCV